MLPNVYIEIQGGALGAVPSTEDNVAGMIIMNTGIASYFNTFYSFEQVKQAISDIPIRQFIQLFYNESGDGKELNVYINNKDAESEVNFQSSIQEFFAHFNTKRIPLLAINVYGDQAILPPITSVIGVVQNMMNQYAAQIRGSLCVLNNPDNYNSGTDFSTLGANRVAMSYVGGHYSQQLGEASTILGRLARIPVQRNIGRVKDGGVIIPSGKMNNGLPTEDYSAEWDTLNNHKVIFYRTFTGKSGYFLNDDHTCTSDTDDFKSIANRRVIDKAYLLVYKTYIEEVNDEISINSDGTLSAVYIKSLQSKIENVINTAMTANGEISSVTCSIDPAQNVLATNRIEIDIRIVPVGYAKEITVRLGFTNPNV
jgi:hypothetical protein